MKIKILFTISILATSLLSCKKHEEDPITDPSIPSSNDTTKSDSTFHLVTEGFFAAGYNYQVHSGNGTILTNDNNLVSIVNTANVNFMSVMKTTQEGKILWQTSVQGMEYNELDAIIEYNNDYYVTGGYYVNGRKQLQVASLNASGVLNWVKIVTCMEGDLSGEDIEVTKDGNLIIAGTNFEVNSQKSTLWLVKVSPNGDILWTKEYPELERTWSDAAVTVLSNGNFLINSIHYYGNGTEPVMYDLKLTWISPSGTIIKSKLVDIQTNESAGFYSKELANGDFMFCDSKKSGSDKRQVFLFRTNKEGDIIWRKEYGEANLGEEGNAFVENLDGSITVVGGWKSSDYFETGSIIIKVDNNGTLQWTKKFGSNLSDNYSYSSCENIQRKTNGDCILTGNYKQQIFVAVTDQNGNFK